MGLTPSQLTDLKTDIQGNSNQTVIDALAAGDVGAIAGFYNLGASPDYWIFKNEVPASELSQAIDLQDMVDITAADKDRVLAMFEIRTLANPDDAVFHGDDPRTRSAWDDVFSAASGDNSQQAINALWTRVATNAEKVFSLSTGSGANKNNADTTSWQGTLTHQDVSAALMS